MKTKNKIFSLILLTAIMVLSSCGEEYLDVTDYASEAKEGGLIRNDNQLVNYVIGSDAAYIFEMLVYQGAVTTKEVMVMKKFTTAAGDVSNTALLKTLTLPVDASGHLQTASLSYSTTYEELIAGLEINGQPISPNDANLIIADFWTLTYVSVTSEGNEHSNGVTSKLAVSTRLAGNYNVDDGIYLHPTAGMQGNFAGLNRIIESVANEPAFATYLATDIGPWTDDLNFFYFYVSNTAAGDGTFPITIPKEYKGSTQLIWGADEIGLCQFNEIPDMSCRMYAELNDDGHDNLFYSYGYIRDTGTRMFDESLTKK